MVRSPQSLGVDIFGARNLLLSDQRAASGQVIPRQPFILRPVSPAGPGLPAHLYTHTPALSQLSTNSYLSHMVLGGGGFDLPAAMSLDAMYKQQGSGARPGSKGQVPAAKKGECGADGDQTPHLLRSSGASRPMGPVSGGRTASVWLRAGTQNVAWRPLLSRGF